MFIFDVYKILNYHGLYKGAKRVIDEFFENYLFDFFNSTLTREAVFKKNYKDIFYKKDLNIKKIKENKDKIILGDKWYQPTYSTPLIKSLEFLKKVILSYKNYEVVFIDIGCGKGKPNYIFSKIFTNIDSYGIELFKYYKSFFIHNMKLVSQKYFFINKNVLDINVNIFSHKKLIILHNKNSFSSHNLILILKKFIKLNTKIILIYNNPHFHKLILRLKNKNID
jgi:hypothetical protein